MARLVLSADDAQKRCGNRTFERLFYLHIVLLVIMAACSVTVWVVMRRTHIESLVLTQVWAESHHQLIREANIYRLIMHAHIAQDQNTNAYIFHQAQKDLDLFERSYSNAKLNNVAFTQVICNSIERWIQKLKDAVTNQTPLTAIEGGDDSQRAKDALWKVVTSYDDKMRNSINYRADVIGMVFLAISTFLVIVLMFLVRAEYLQHQATIQLAEELASVIHDVRTPQQVIVSAISLLSQPAMIAEDTVELIQVISDSCSATQRLLDTALLRIRARALSEPIPLPYLFKSVSNIQSVACREKQLQWRFTLSKRAHVSAIFDRDAVLQIVNNIISNAIRYTDHGAVQLTVDLEPAKRPRFSCCHDGLSSKHKLVITVADTGRGIPRKSLAVIFQKFQQVKSGSGFGIGLFTVARLINSCNGCIDVWSELGKGTKFVISIPIRAIATCPVEDESTSSSGSCTYDSGPSMDNNINTLCLKVVLLDDDAVTMKLSKRILTCAGHNVIVFSNGSDLLNHFQDADVVVSDVNMPGGMTGIEVALRLRAAGYQGALIAHTGDNFAFDSCIRSGFDAVLAKPTSASAYIETIESVYRKRKARLEDGPNGLCLLNEDLHDDRYSKLHSDSSSPNAAA